MTRLRIAGMASLVLGLLVGGCGSSGDSTPHDSGMVHPDLSTGVDAGPHDSGPVGVDMPTVDMGHMGTGTCPTGACNLADGTGCGAGMGCEISTTTPVTAVCQATGTGVSGTTCATPADCAAGFFCNGTCEHYCCTAGSSVGCPTGQSCNVDLTDAAGTSTGAFLCSNTDDGCDVLAQTGCPAMEACYPGMMVTQCAGPGMVAPGGTCVHLNDCGARYACVGMTGGANTCQQICAMGVDAGAVGMCPSGMTCGMVTGFPTTLGVCG